MSPAYHKLSWVTFRFLNQLSYISFSVEVDLSLTSYFVIHFASNIELTLFHVLLNVCRARIISIKGWLPWPTDCLKEHETVQHYIPRIYPLPYASLTGSSVHPPSATSAN